MQAISSPTPDQGPSPISSTAAPAVVPKPTRYRQWMILTLVALAGFAAGYLIPDTTARPPVPDVHNTMQWMFDAALAYEATTEGGKVVPAALPGISVEEVETVDPVRGPIVAIVSDQSDNLSAYRIVVERHNLDWTVTATRLGNQSD